MRTGTRERTRRPPAPDVDPRISARREEVRRDRGRRWLRRLVWTLVVATVPALLFAATRSPAFDVDRFEVAGAGESGVLSVVEASGIAFGDPMTDLDLASAAEGIEGLPWVRDAVVERDWPGTLRLTVTEWVPVAVVALEGGEWALIADDGHVPATTTGPGSLPILAIGGIVPEPGGRLDPSATDLVAVAAGLGEETDGRPVTLRASEHGVELITRPGGIILIGGTEDLQAKLDAVRTMEARVDLECMEQLDVRVPSAPVLTREVECQ